MESSCLSSRTLLTSIVKIVAFLTMLGKWGWQDVNRDRPWRDHRRKAKPCACGPIGDGWEANPTGIGTARPALLFGPQHLRRIGRSRPQRRPHQR